jgi:enamine deaminase RidA (YjgF/YER057c/UK114 family)
MSWNLNKLPSIYGGSKDYPGVNAGTIQASGSIVIGNLVFLSSSAINNSDINEFYSLNIEKQVITTLQNLKQGLKSAGSSLENLVKYYIFLKNASDASSVWKTMLKYFELEAPALLIEPPAIAVSEVVGFEKPACLIEIDAIAVVSGNKPGWEVKKYPMSYGGVNQTYPGIQAGTPFL